MSTYHVGPSELSGPSLLIRSNCVTIRFMDVLWQNDQGFNPADAVVGPAAFDDHLCWCSLFASGHSNLTHVSSSDYSFGGVADPNPEAYLTSICSTCLAAHPLQILNSLVIELDLPRVQNDTDLGNDPMFFGEWALSTNFNAVRHSAYTSLHMSNLLIF